MGLPCYMLQSVDTPFAYTSTVVWLIDYRIQSAFHMTLLLVDTTLIIIILHGTHWQAIRYIFLSSWMFECFRR